MSASGLVELASLCEKGDSQVAWEDEGVRKSGKQRSIRGGIVLQTKAMLERRIRKKKNAGHAGGEILQDAAE